MRALAHGERRLFLRECLDRECAAGELAEVSSLALASVSEHLKVLRKTGLLTLEVRGRFWMYRTDPARLQEVMAALQASFEGTDHHGT
nr:helix-turn-helix domain-containing protein [Pelomonas sp. P8]